MNFPKQLNNKKSYIFCIMEYSFALINTAHRANMEAQWILDIEYSTENSGTEKNCFLTTKKMFNNAQQATSISRFFTY